MEKKRVFITGISGFAGSFLAEFLVSQGTYDVSGTYVSDASVQNLDQVKDQVSLHKVDLREKDQVVSLIKEVKPDIVFHLAALASPADSFENPIETLTNNIGVEVNVFESLRQANLLDTRILITSSADVYGMVAAEDLPIDENTPLRPTNPYAVSKIAQDFLGLQYFLSYKMPIVRVRPFNHIGPRQSPHFAVAAFARKIAEIENGKIPPVLKVGNLETYRDFTDVRDMVRAYTLLIEKGTPGDVYNIGSAQAYKMHDIVEKLVSFSASSIPIEVDPELIRPADTPKLVCDNSKMQALTGWKPSIPCDQTLKDTLDYWRSIV